MTSPDRTTTALSLTGPSGRPIDAAALGALGITAPAEPQLAAMVAALLGRRQVEVLDARVDVHPYPFPALTTRDRFVVSRTARGRNSDEHPYAFFVKVVQSWARSALSCHVPAPLRTTVAQLMPWRTEPDLCRSDLRDRLPAGLTVPHVFGVHDLDEDSTAIWLELVPGRPGLLGPRPPPARGVPPGTTGGQPVGRPARHPRSAGPHRATLRRRVVGPQRAPGPA